MLLVGRYLRREIVAAVAFVLLGFLALFAFFDLINELEDVGRGGYRLQHAVAFVLLGLPSHVYELMPIAALIGSIYALSQLASHSEYTAMRAAGLGRRRALGVGGRERRHPAPARPATADARVSRPSCPTSTPPARRANARRADERDPRERRDGLTEPGRYP